MRQLVSVLTLSIILSLAKSIVAQNCPDTTGRFVLESHQHIVGKDIELTVSIIPCEKDWNALFPKSSGRWFITRPSAFSPDGVVRFPRQTSSTHEAPDYEAACKFVAGNLSVSRVNADFCRLGPEEIAMLATIPRLRSLSVVNAGLTDADLAALEEAKGLTELDLSNNLIGGKGGLCALRKLRQITSLGLAGTQINDSDSEFISACTELTELRLHDTAISDATVQRLSDIRHLAKIDISNCRISSMSADSLLRFPHLTEVHVSRNNIGEEFLDKLSRHTGLVSIWALDTTVSPDYLEKWRAAHPKIRLFVHSSQSPEESQ